MKRLLEFLVLPSAISRFERDYLARMNRIGLWFFCAHVPVMMLVAFLAHTSIWRASLYTMSVLLGPLLAHRFLDNPRHIARTYAFASMCMGGLLVHFGQGDMQIEMHFYFFVLIALLAAFGDPMVVVIAAVTVALHHVVLWLVVPESVFNYEA